jgi:excisionase family DNA binding protein
MTTALAPVSYTYQDAAAAVGVSVDVIRRAVRTGDLEAHYPTSRPVILAADLKAWVESAPTTRTA